MELNCEVRLSSVLYLRHLAFVRGKEFGILQPPPYS